MTQDEIWTGIISDILALYGSESLTGLQKAKQLLAKKYTIYLREQKIELRKSMFKDSIRPYVITYGRDMCNAFFLYWSETNHSGKKMRFELERTWEVAKRLATWQRNESNNKQFAKKSEPGLPAKLGENYGD